MRKIVKVIAVILVMMLFAAMALGSGSDNADEVKAPADVSVDGGSVSEEKEEPAASQETEKETEPETAPEKIAVTIEEAVLVEEGNVRITAKSLETDSMFGPSVKLLIENNADKALTVQVRNVSVNGYMIETMISTDVAAGKKSNDEIVFMESDLEAAGITTIADIELSFHVFDSETWDTYFDTDQIIIKTSAAEGFEYVFDNSGDLVYNENGVEIVIRGLSEGFIGPEVVVYISNSTEKNICVQVRDVSINGFMVDTIFSRDVAAGKHAVDSISFLSSELEENDITAITDIELYFHIFDSDTWSTIADTSVISLSFTE